MTIKPGQSWGVIVERPEAPVVAPDDAALAEHLAAGDPRPVLVTGGDLLRMLGGSSHDGRVRRYPIDALRVELDGEPTGLAVAHVLVRGAGRLGWWRGPLWAACNGSFVGRWDVMPRAHPNDGRVDVIEVAATMGLRARRQAQRRLPTGSHLPHPDITVTRPVAATCRAGSRQLVFVDGRPTGPAARVTVTVVPDAGVVHA